MSKRLNKVSVKNVREASRIEVKSTVTWGRWGFWLQGLVGSVDGAVCRGFAAHDGEGDLMVYRNEQSALRAIRRLNPDCQVRVIYE